MFVAPFILNQQHSPSYETTISQSEFFFNELFEWLLSVNPFLFCSLKQFRLQWRQYLWDGDGFRCECGAVFALSIFHANSQRSQQRQQCVVNKCFEYFLQRCGVAMCFVQNNFPIYSSKYKIYRQICEIRTTHELRVREQKTELKHPNKK